MRALAERRDAIAPRVPDRGQPDCRPALTMRRHADVPQRGGRRRRGQRAGRIPGGVVPVRQRDRRHACASRKPQARSTRAGRAERPAVSRRRVRESRTEQHRRIPAILGAADQRRSSATAGTSGSWSDSKRMPSMRIPASSQRCCSRSRRPAAATPARAQSPSAPPPAVRTTRRLRSCSCSPVPSAISRTADLATISGGWRRVASYRS